MLYWTNPNGLKDELLVQEGANAIPISDNDDTCQLNILISNTLNTCNVVLVYMHGTSRVKIPHSDILQLSSCMQGNSQTPETFYSQKYYTYFFSIRKYIYYHYKFQAPVGKLQGLLQAGCIDRFE